MSMNKVIHAAFRRDLDRFLSALGRFRDGDADRAAQLGRAWDNFDFQLTKHHEGEHEIAWPALARVGVTQQMIDQMDAEHDVMAERLSAARNAMTVFRSAPTADNAETARTAMDELKTVTNEHLEHEERELEPVYQDKHDDPAIVAMGKKFSKVPPKEGGVFFAWLTDGISPEATESINATIPKPVRAVISGLLGRSYKKDIAPVWHS
jgi:Hemerythrin HHE cation binding domain